MNGQGERKEKIKPASEVGARLAGLWKKTGARIVNAAKALDPSLPEGAALAAAAFLLGRTAIVGARPFGFALLAAAPRDVPLIAVGLLLSALTVGGSDGIMLASVCLFTVALRLAVRALIDPPRDGGISASAFGENVYLRMASASVGCNAAIQRSLPGVSEASPSSATTAAELPSLSGASKSHANCSESSRFVIVTAFPSFPPCRADVHASTDYRTNVRPFC